MRLYVHNKNVFLYNFQKFFGDLVCLKKEIKNR